jgi:hypothetical protein
LTFLVYDKFLFITCLSLFSDWEVELQGKMPGRDMQSAAKVHYDYAMRQYAAGLFSDALSSFDRVSTALMSVTLLQP